MGKSTIGADVVESTTQAPSRGAGASRLATILRLHIVAKRQGFRMTAISAFGYGGLTAAESAICELAQLQPGSHAAISRCVALLPTLQPMTLSSHRPVPPYGRCRGMACVDSAPPPGFFEDRSEADERRQFLEDSQRRPP